MKLHISSLSAIAAASFLVANAYGAPSITQTSGTFSNGSSVTIKGSGFGNKSSAPPLVFDNFESGSNGTKVMTSNAVVGKWQNGAGHDQPIYSTEQAHSGSKSAKLAARPGAYNLSVNQNGSFPVVYMDWWVRVNLKDNVSRNWKPWRLYGANDAMTANTVVMCNGNGLSIINETREAGFWWGEGGSVNNGKWQHYQVLLKASSSPGAADGAVKQYINGRLASDHSGIVTRTSSSHWNQIRIGHYWATDAVAECGSNGGADIYLDNVYIDTTWARVELGNASTYAASTERAIQIPTSWSANSITFNVNTGAFKEGSTAYIYVVDSNDNVNSSGIPVKIGAGSNGPLPPSDLTVN